MSQTETGTDQEARRAGSVRELTRRRSGERGPLIEILHDVQAEHGWISEADVREIADVLNLSVADVHGVVSFYHDFRRTPPPAHTVQICRAEACQSVGADALHAEVTQALAGRDDVEVRDVFCFGNCALGPSVAVDGVLRGRCTAESVLARTDQRTGQRTGGEQV